MAADNTLGPYSPYEGRIYAAFTGHNPVPGNPATNTDVYLTYSDDAGRTWSTPKTINGDTAFLDGSSGANEVNGSDVFTGRSQFQPALAVDRVTGTLVASWRDARNDPNNTLVATYITASIDGGATFNAQTWANPSLMATDAIDTQTQVNLGPEADNGTAANAANSPFGFGASIGLAVYDGRVYPLWAGNFDQTAADGTTLNSFSAEYRPMVIAAGPRVINSTMGPIPYAEAQGGNVTFTVTFDRPINPSGTAATFLPADVQVFYHDTTNGSTPIPLYVKSVVPVASSGVGTNAKFGYTEFTVSFDPAFQPGTNGNPGAPPASPTTPAPTAT